MQIFIPSFERLYERHSLTLVDVGASGGISDYWKPAKNHLRVIGFEPDPREYAALVARGDKRMTYLRTALFSEKKSLKLHLTRKQETSSIFLPNRELLNSFPDAERYEVVGEAIIEADTLDSQLATNGIENVDFIKLDTQGSELFILQGASHTLGAHVFGVEVELEFAELYKGQPLFCAVNEFLLEAGFWLFDLRRQFFKRTLGIGLGANKGQLMFCDALYLKTPVRMERIVAQVEDADARKAKVLNALAVYVLYGYFDYAMEILEKLAPVFSGAEQLEIRGWLERRGRSAPWLRKLTRAPRVGAAFDILSSFLRGNRQGWSFSDRKLGNKL